jgi:hypothetical protein
VESRIQTSAGEGSLQYVEEEVFAEAHKTVLRIVKIEMKLNVPLLKSECSVSAPTS